MLPICQSSPAVDNSTASTLVVCQPAPEQAQAPAPAPVLAPVPQDWATVAGLGERLNQLSSRQQQRIWYSLWTKHALKIEVSGLAREEQSRGGAQTPMAVKTCLVSVRVTLSPPPPAGTTMRVPVTVHSNGTNGEQVTPADLNGLHTFTRDAARLVPMDVVLSVGASGQSKWEKFHFGFTGQKSVFFNKEVSFFLRATLEDGGGPPVEDDSEDFLICARKLVGHELHRTVAERSMAKQSKAKKSKAEVDSNAPKKPTNARTLCLQAMKDAWVAESRRHADEGPPGQPPFPNLFNWFKPKWDCMAALERLPFTEKHEAAKKQYTLDLAAYKEGKGKPMEGAPAADQLASSLEPGGLDGPAKPPRPTQPCMPAKAPKAAQAPVAPVKRALSEGSVLPPAKLQACEQVLVNIDDAFAGLAQEDAAEAIEAAARLASGFA